jgi:quercetin dioxygenase-like cupin family protein
MVLFDTLVSSDTIVQWSCPDVSDAMPADSRERLTMPIVHQPGQDAFRAIHPEDIEWKQFAAFPPAARLAVLIGDPSQPGPYVIRVRLPAGTRMMPHKHPEDRIYTVLSGVFYIGLGEKFDESRLTAYGVGTVIVLPGGQPHFHWAKSGEYVTQVTAIGPLGLSYVDTADDPRLSRT